MIYRRVSKYVANHIIMLSNQLGHTLPIYYIYSDLFLPLHACGTEQQNQLLLINLVYCILLHADIIPPLRERNQLLPVYYVKKSARGGLGKRGGGHGVRGNYCYYSSEVIQF